MKIFLSGLDGVTSWYESCWLERLDSLPFKLKWNLLSYFYVRKKDRQRKMNIICEKSEAIMIDSGAHSFQKGAVVDWESYTREYADFIKKFDRPNVIGFFEMDVDSIIGYARVLELRKILQGASDKIIPVWHKNRGIDEYERMCEEFAGKVIAISGFKNEDITDDQYLMFLKKAKQYGCKVHCLGMTRRAIIDKVPFDYTDSSSWAQAVFWGFAYSGSLSKKKKISREQNSTNIKRDDLALHNYRQWVRIQEYYYQKWRLYDEDFRGIGWRQIARQ